MPFDGRTFNPVIAAILIEGRRRVVESWFQGPGVPSYEQHCGVLAISRQNAGEITDVALRLLAHAIDGSDDTGAIQRYNDEPGRTLGDMLAIYDKAIAAVSH